MFADDNEDEDWPSSELDRYNLASETPFHAWMVCQEEEALAQVGRAERNNSATTQPSLAKLERPISVLVSVVEEALGCMVLDTACQKFVAGDAWLEDFSMRTAVHGLEIQQTPEHEVFKFGAGAPQVSRIRARLPAAVNGRPFECRTSICRGMLPCLASIVACEQLGLVLNLLRGCAYFLNLGPEEIPLLKTTTGHLCVSLTDYPKKYPQAPADDDGREGRLRPQIGQGLLRVGRRQANGAGLS